MVSKSPKHILFSTILLVLILPGAQHALQFINSGKLNGDVVYAADTAFTLKGWFNGSFQEKKNAYLNDNMGFRPDFVRLNNQLDFSLFRLAHARGVVVGKDNCLYEAGYINAFRGIDYKQNSAIRERLFKVKAVQDTLSRLGKRLIVVCAPSKARYYSELFPALMPIAEGKPNNYRDFMRIADSLTINVIDFSSWFAAQRTSTNHLLISKYGIHWTYYGAFIAGDSLVKYIERADYIDLPDLVIDKIAYSSEPKLQEQDIEEGLNLIVPLDKERFTRPEFHYIDDSTKKRPKMIFIGDSFLWTLMYNYIPHNISKGWEMWYYFSQVWTEGNDSVPAIKDYDWKGTIARSDYIILLYTEPHLPEIGNGFVEQYYDHYYPNQ